MAETKEKYNQRQKSWSWPLEGEGRCGEMHYADRYCMECFEEYGDNQKDDTFKPVEK